MEEAADKEFFTIEWYAKYMAESVWLRYMRVLLY
jgi:hypothetical protein